MKSCLFAFISLTVFAALIASFAAFFLMSLDTKAVEPKKSPRVIQ